jgi:hypothetical protein
MLKRPPARLSSKDFDKLTLCLNLTLSDQDGEALAAIRGANRILERYNLTWERVWYDIENRMYDEVVSRIPTVPEALAELLTLLKPSSFRTLISGFQKRWDDRGDLTERQREVVLDAYERHHLHLKRKTNG